MQLECWSIQGVSFHFGQHGLGQENTMATMPSDSLFAALVARLARTGGAQAVQNFCKLFLNGGDPPFVLSSTFPLAGNVRFFPVPALARRGAADAREKEFKRVEFLSEGAFRNVLDGKSLKDIFNADHLLQGGKMLLTAEDFKALPAELQKKNAEVWKNAQRPRVALDRSTSQSNLFFVGEVRFAAQCGLWFAVHWLKNDGAVRGTFSNLLHDLAAAGLGAERASGMGISEVNSMSPIELPDVQNAWVTLSRYLPAEDEVSALGDGNSAYSIKSVGGWLDSPNNMGQRRRSVNLIEEGSVIGVKPLRVVPGQMVDVQPRYKVDDAVIEPLGHEVFRCGLALAVGMQGGTG